MITLFKYKVGDNDNSLIQNIYADTVDNSLSKWLDSIKDVEDSQDKGGLKSLLGQSKISKIQRLEGTENTFYFVITTNLVHQTIYINKIEIQPDFIADLEYLATEKGGRKGYAASGYRPQVKFPFTRNTTSGEQIFWNKDKVYPGESVRAQIRILDHITFKNALSGGMTFEFCEGSTVVGTGEIIAVINVELKKANR